MKLGLFGINMGPCAEPETAARVAGAAEEAGFDSVWTGEHVVLPDPQAPPSPAAPETAMLDPAACLAFLAGRTRRVRLATGIIILPQRNPLVLAKELASVDVLSGGRLHFGLGAGYLEPEFSALGIPFAERGARTSEAIEVIRALWTQRSPRFDGRFWSFEGIQAMPRPVQDPHPPIVVGGHSPPAYRRAVRQGDGWYGFALDLDRTRDALDGLRPGGRSVVAMSHRCFPTKAILAFHALGHDARIQLVQRYHELAGGFEDVAALDRSPEGADPLWIVSARRRAD